MIVHDYLKVSWYFYFSLYSCTHYVLVYTSYKPIVRTVVGEYWSEVLTVWTKYSKVRVQKMQEQS